MTNTKKSFSWGEFLLGVLFILIGFVAFWDPVGNLLSLTVIFGVVALIKGIYELFFRRLVREYIGFSSVWLTVLGIVDLVIGILFLFNLYKGMMVLPYLFAIWMIVDSVFNLLMLEYYKAEGKNQYWFALIVSIITICIGVFLFVRPIVAALTLSFLVGIYFIWFGILMLISAFSEIES